MLQKEGAERGSQVGGWGGHRCYLGQAQGAQCPRAPYQTDMDARCKGQFHPPLVCAPTSPIWKMGTVTILIFPGD